MEELSLSTLIQFVNGESGGGGDTPVNPGSIAAQTGDFFLVLVAILACAFVLLGGFYIMNRQLRLNAGDTSTFKSAFAAAFSNTRSKMVICATVLVCFLTLVFSGLAVVSAFAADNPTVPDKITAKVYPSTNTIEVENGYIDNQTMHSIIVDNSNALTTESTAAVSGIDTMHVVIVPQDSTKPGYLYSGFVGEDVHLDNPISFEPETTSTIRYTIDAGQVNVADLIDKTIQTNLFYYHESPTPTTALLTYKVADNWTTYGHLDGPIEPAYVPIDTSYTINGKTLYIDGIGTISAEVEPTFEDTHEFDRWVPSSSGTVQGDINFVAYFKVKGSDVALVEFDSNDDDKGEIVNDTTGEEQPDPIQVPIGTAYHFDEYGNLYIGNYVFYGYASHGNVLDNWAKDGQATDLESGTIEKDTVFTGLFITNKFTLSFAATDHGKIDQSQKVVTGVPYNTLYEVKNNTITIQPYEGSASAQTFSASSTDSLYQFAYWTNNGQKLENGTRAVVSDMNITAVFEIKTLELNFYTEDSSQGQPERWRFSDIPANSQYRVTDKGEIQFNWGGAVGEIKVAAVAQEGYEFAYWTTSQGGTPIPRDTVYDINNNTDFWVYFKVKNYIVSFVTENVAFGNVQKNSESATSYFTVENVPYGTVLTRTDDKKVTFKDASGTTYTASAIANGGYKFADWNVSPLSDKVKGDTVFTAAFIAEGTDTINAYFSSDNDDQGTVTAGSLELPVGSTYSISGDTITIKSNGKPDQQIKANAKSGFVFDHWTVNDQDSKTGIVDSSHQFFVAYFTGEELTISLSSWNPTFGSVFPSKITKVKAGAWVDIDDNGDIYIDGVKKAQARPATGYQFDCWYDSDFNVLPMSFELEKADVMEWAINFKPNTFDLYFSPATKGGTIDIRNLEDIAYGATYRVLATQEGDYPAGSLEITDPETNEVRTVKVQAADGYNFDCWKINDRAVTSGTIKGETDFFVYFAEPEPGLPLDIQISTALETSPGEYNFNDHTGGSVDVPLVMDVPTGSKYIPADGVLAINGKLINATPASSDHKFVGWYYKGALVEEKGTVTSEDKFYAVFKYEPQTYTVNFATSDVAKGHVAKTYSNAQATSLNVIEGTKFVINGDKLTIGEKETAVSLIAKPNDTSIYYFSAWENFGTSFEGYITEDTTFTAKFNQNIETLTFKGETYMDVYDIVEGSAKPLGPMDDYSVQVYAGTTYTDGSPVQVPMAEVDFFKNFFGSLLGNYTPAPGEYIQFTDTENHVHKVYCQPKLDFDGVVHLSGWNTNPQVGVNEGIKKDVTFTPSIERDTFELEIIVDDVSEGIGDLWWNIISPRQGVRIPHEIQVSETSYYEKLPYGIEVTFDGDKIYFYDPYDPESEINTSYVSCEVWGGGRYDDRDFTDSYHFGSWSAPRLDGNTIVADTTITAHMDLNQYTIKVGSSGNGSVETSNSQYEFTVPHGTPYNFYESSNTIQVDPESANPWYAWASPYESFEFYNWDFVATKDGEPVNLSTFGSVTCDLTFTANFNKGMDRIYVGIDAEWYDNEDEDDEEYEEELHVRNYSDDPRAEAGMTLHRLPSYIDFCEVVNGVDRPILMNYLAISVPRDTGVTYSYYTKDGWNYTVVSGIREKLTTTTSRVFKSRINSSFEGNDRIYNFDGWKIDGVDVDETRATEVAVKPGNNNSVLAKYNLSEYQITLKVNEENLYQYQTRPDEGFIYNSHSWDSSLEKSLTFNYKNNFSYIQHEEDNIIPDMPYSVGDLYIKYSPSNNVHKSELISIFDEQINKTYNNFVGWKIVSGSTTGVIEERYIDEREYREYASYGKVPPTWYSVYGGNITLEAVFEEVSSTITYTSVDPQYKTGFGNVSLSATEDSGSTYVSEKIYKFSGQLSDLGGAYAFGSNFDDTCVWTNEDGDVVWNSAMAQQNGGSLRHFVPLENPAGGDVWFDHVYHVLFIPALALYDPQTNTMTFTCENGADEGYDKSNIFPVYSTFDVGREIYIKKEMRQVLDKLADVFRDINGDYKYSGRGLSDEYLDYPSWQYSDNTWKVHPEKITFDSSFSNFKSLTGTAHWFDTSNDLSTSITSIDNLSNIYTNGITDMAYMFAAYVDEEILVSREYSEFEQAATKASNVKTAYNGIGYLDIEDVSSDDDYEMELEEETPFYGLTSIDLSGWNASKVTSVENMFAGQQLLSNVSLPYSKAFWSLCTNYEAMFQDCYSLASLNVLDKVNGTQNYFGAYAEDMSRMFQDCTSLTSFNVSSSLFGSQAYDLNGMFANCYNLKTFKLASGIPFGSQAYDLSYMFEYCSSLTSLDFSNNSLGANAEYVYATFCDCSSLNNLNIYNFFDNGNYLDGYSNMLSGCSDLAAITIGPGIVDRNFDYDQRITLYSLGLPDTEYWYNSSFGTEGFYSDEIPYLDWGSRSDYYGTWRKVSAKALYNASKSELKFVYDSNIYTDPTVKVYYISSTPTGYIAGKGYGFTLNGNQQHSQPVVGPGNSLTSDVLYAKKKEETVDISQYLDLSLFNLKLPPWYTIVKGQNDSDYKIRLDAPAQNVVFDNSFKNYDKLLSLSCWFMADSYGTKAFTNFYSINDSKAQIPGFESLNTTNVQSFASMFGGFSKFLSLNLSSEFSYQKHTKKLANQGVNKKYTDDSYTSAMEKLSKVRLSVQDTYNTNLTNIDISTLKVQFGDEWSGRNLDLGGMFANCTALSSVKLPTMDNLGVDTAYAYSMYGMFYNCASLRSTQNITGFSDLFVPPSVAIFMFAGCTNLEYIDLTNWETGKVGVTANANTYYTGMLYDCNNLTTIRIHENDGRRISWTAGLDRVLLCPTETEDEQYMWTWENGPAGFNHEYSASVIPTDEMLYLADQDVELTRSENQIHEHTVSVATENYGGSLTPNGNSFTYANNISYHVENNVLLVGNKRYTANAFTDAGYAFKFWSVNGKRIFDGDYAVLQEDALFTASFESSSLTAKALYDKNNNTLTFVYDANSYANNSNVEVFNIEDNAKYPSWITYTQRGYTRSGDQYDWPYLSTKVPNATKVIFAESFANYDKLESCQLWFAADSDGLQPYKEFYSVVNGVQKPGFANLNTYSVKKVSGMFGGLFQVSNNDIETSSGSSWVSFLRMQETSTIYASPYNTYGYSFKELDLSTLNLNQVKDWSGLLSNAIALEKVTFQNDINLARPTAMTAMFANCENLKGDASQCIINLGKFNSTNTTDIRYLFYGCSNLTKLDLSNFNTVAIFNEATTRSFVANAANCLYDCVRLSDITWNLSGQINTSNFYWNATWNSGWTLNFTTYGLGNYNSNDEQWMLLSNSIPNSSRVAGNTYALKDFPVPNYPISDDEHNPFSSGRIVKDAPKENKVVFEVDEDCINMGTINHTETTTSYNFINSAQIVVDSVENNVLYGDNAVYIARPNSSDYRFKYWTYGKGFDDELQGHAVPADFAETYYATDYTTEKHFVAVFESTEYSAKAVFTPAKTSTSQATMTFVYDNEPHTGQIVFPVIPNSSDNIFPSWYTSAGKSWHAGDNHNIPKFDSRIEEGAPNGIKVVFDSSFANYDALTSTSCWFMPAVDSNDDSKLFSPFTFNQANFSGLQYINTDNLINVKYMFGGHEYFNDYTGAKLNNTTIDLTGFNIGSNGKTGSDYKDYRPLTNISGLFANCPNLENVTFGSKFDWSNVTNASYLFYNCKTMINDTTSSLLTKNLQKVKANSLTDISYMLALYYDDYSLTEDDIVENKTITLPETFITDNVTNFAGLFSGHKDTQGLTIVSTGAAFDTSAAQNMDSLFANNKNMTDYNLDAALNFDTYNVRDMSYMFSGCSALEDTDTFVKYFNTYSVIDTSYMFNGCSSLTRFNIQRPNYSWEVHDASYMFKDCTSLTSVDLSNFSFNFDTSTSKNPCLGMFYITSTGGANNVVDTIYISQDTIWNYSFTFADMGISTQNSWYCSEAYPTEYSSFRALSPSLIPNNDDESDNYSPWGSFTRNKPAVVANVDSAQNEWGYVYSDVPLGLDNSICLTNNYVRTDVPVPIDYDDVARVYIEYPGSQTIVVETDLTNDAEGNIIVGKTYRITAQPKDSSSHFWHWNIHWNDYDWEDEEITTDPIYIDLDEGNVKISAIFTGVPPIVWVKWLDEDSYKLIFTRTQVDAGPNDEVYDFYEAISEDAPYWWYDYNEYIESVEIDESFRDVQFERANSFFANMPKLTHLDLSNLNLSKTKDMYRMFYGDSNLIDIILPDCEFSASIYNTFYNCGSLQSIDFGGMVNVTAADECYLWSSPISMFTIGEHWQTSMYGLVDNSSEYPSSWTNENGQMFTSDAIPYYSYSGTFYKASDKRIYINNFGQGIKDVTGGDLELLFNSNTKLEYYADSETNELSIRASIGGNGATVYSGYKADCEYGCYFYGWGDSDYYLQKDQWTEITSNDYEIYPTASIDRESDLLYVGNTEPNVYTISYGHIPEQAKYYPLDPDYTARSDGGSFVSPFYWIADGAGSQEFEYPSDIKQINIDETVSQFNGFKNMNYYFSYMDRLTAINHFEYINTQNVVDMRSMFYGDASLGAIDFSNLRLDRVVNTSEMFVYCNDLWEIYFSNESSNANLVNIDHMFAHGMHDKIDLSNIDFKTVTSMSGLFDSTRFYNDVKTDVILPETFDTSNVTNMSGLFSGDSLTTFNLARLNTSSVTDMSYMFSGNTYGPDAVDNFGFSNFNTSKVQDMSNMFAYVEGFEDVDLDLSSFNTSNVTSMYGMFQQDYDNERPVFKSINIKSFDTKNVTEFSYMFEGFNINTDTEGSDSTLDLRSFNTKKGVKFYEMFCNSNFTRIYVDETKWQINSSNTFEMMEGTYDLEGQMGTTIDGLGYDWENDATYARVDKVKDDPDYGGLLSTNKDAKVVFRYYSDTGAAEVRLPLLSGNNFMLPDYDGSSIEMYLTCDEVNYQAASDTVWYEDDDFARHPAVFPLVNNYVTPSSIDPLPWSELLIDDDFRMNVKRITIDDSFKEATTALNPETGESETFTHMNWYFASLAYLEEVNGLHNLPTTLKSYQRLFDNDSALESITINGLLGTGVEDFSCMFNCCDNLKYIDSAGIDTSSAKDMSYMFAHTGFTELDLSGMNTSHVEKMDYMFEECLDLQKIYIDPEAKEWSTASVTSSANMFQSCGKLEGQQGTTIAKVEQSGVSEADAISATYACFDEGIGSAHPGYFSEGPSYAKAVVTENPDTGITMTFYYDTKTHSTDANSHADTNGQYVYRLTDTNKGYIFDSGRVDKPTWFTWEGELLQPNVASVVFDSSFKSYTVVDFGNGAGNTFSGLNHWFRGFTSLQSITGWENVTLPNNDAYFTFTFAGCTSLPSLDLSGLGNIEYAHISNAFAGSQIQTLDISSFIGLCDATDAFLNCSSLNTIYVSEDYDETVIRKDDGSNGQVFADCWSLAGMMGTTYYDVLDSIDEDTANSRKYAKIDGGIDSGSAGYFSIKNTLYYKVENNVLHISNSDTGSGWSKAEKALLSTKPEDVAWNNGTKYNSVVIEVDEGTFIKPSSMAYWFTNQNQLTSIEGLENIQTARLGNLAYTFAGCSKLTELNLKFFNTTNVSDMTSLFAGCTSLQTIYVTRNAWNIQNLSESNNIFKNCGMLVGGAGTHASSVPDIQRTIDYAYIDMGESRPGFLTEAKHAQVVEYVDGTLRFVYDNKDYNNKIVDGKSEILGSWPIIYNPAKFVDDPQFHYEQGAQPWTSELSNPIRVVEIDESFKEFTKYDYFGDWESELERAYPASHGEGQLLLQSENNAYSKYALDTYGFGYDVINIDNWFSGLNNKKRKDRVRADAETADGRLEVYSDNEFGMKEDESYTTSSGQYLFNIKFVGLENINMTKVESMVGTFSALSNAEFDNGLANLDVSNVTNMAQCFEYSSFNNGFGLHAPIAGQPNSGWNTSKVSDMSGMFHAATFEQAPLSINLDTTSLLYTYDMFDEFMGNINFVKFNTSNVTDMDNMFYNAKITSSILDLSKFNTGKVQSMNEMFSGIELRSNNPAELNLSSFDTSNVTEMNYMFANLGDAFTYLDLTSFKTSKLMEAEGMFFSGEGGTSLTSIYVDSTKWYISEVAKTDNMFANCNLLKGQNGTTRDYLLKRGIETDRELAISGKYAVVDDLESYGYLSEFDNTVTAKAVLYCMKKYDSPDESDFAMEFVYDNKKYPEFKPSSGLELKQGEVFKVYTINKNTDYSNEEYAPWFDDEGNLEYPYICTVRIEPNFADFNSFVKDGETEQLTSISGWFAKMLQLGSISGLEYISPTTVDGQTGAIKYTLDNMSDLFANSKALESVSLKGMHTENVTNMSNMFANMTSLYNVDVSTLDTTNVTNMNGMFKTKGTDQILELDLRSFNTANVTDMDKMFSQQIGLRTIYVSPYNPSTNTGWIIKDCFGPSMFEDCKMLVGEQGTSHEGMPTPDSIKWAVIDNPPLSPGYLSQGKEVAKAVFTQNSETGITMTFYYDRLSHQDDPGIISVNEKRLRQVPAVYELDYWTGYDGEDYILPRWFRGESFSNYGDTEYIPKPMYNPDHVVFDSSFSGFQYYPATTEPGMNELSEENVLGSRFSQAPFNNIDNWFLNFSNLKDVTGWENIKFATSTFTMDGAFAYCTALKSVDMSSMDKYYLSSAYDTFYRCNTIESIDLSKIIDFGYDNSGMSGIKFNGGGAWSIPMMSKGYGDYYQMFSNCYNLKDIYVSDTLGMYLNINNNASTIGGIGIGIGQHFPGGESIISKLGTPMFENCYSLVGQFGTNYIDEWATDSDDAMTSNYAVLDGPDTPGYFSLHNSLYYYNDGHGNLFLSATQQGDEYEACNDTLNSTDATDVPWHGDTTIKHVYVEHSEDFGIYPFSMAYWFDGLTNLEDVNGLENITTSRMTNLTNTFNGCAKLASVDIKYFDTSSVTSMDNMFNGCSSLTTVYAQDSVWSTESVLTSKDMFKGCDALVGSDGTKAVDYTDKTCTYARIDKAQEGVPGFFSRSKTAKAVALADNKTGKVTFKFVYDDVDYYNYESETQTVIKDSTNQLAIYPIKYTAYNNPLNAVYTLSETLPKSFSNNSEIKGATSDSMQGMILPAWIDTEMMAQQIEEGGKMYLPTKVKPDSIAVDSSFADFRYYDYVGSDDMFGKEVTNLDFWFAGFENAKGGSVSISGLDNIQTNFKSTCGMFASSKLNGENAKEAMSKLKSEKVESMLGMFAMVTVTDATASALGTLNVDLDTSNVTTMRFMFNRVTANGITFTKIDTKNVVDMGSMFENYLSQTLDLSMFDTTNVHYTDYMFAFTQEAELDANEDVTPELKTIIVDENTEATQWGHWDIGDKYDNDELIGENMFLFQISLEGGEGYKYVIGDMDSSSAEYARVDHSKDPLEEPGYLTQKKSQSNLNANAVDEKANVANVSGKVSFAKPDAGNHVQVMEAELPVHFVYEQDGVEQKLTALTDELGNYKFKNVPVGVTGTIKFAYNGYAGQIDNVTVPEQGLTGMDIVTKSFVTLDGFSWEQLNQASEDIAVLGADSVYYKEFKRMMDARELKDVELKADKNGVKNHIYVRVANILSNAEFNALVVKDGLLPGVQFAICDKTNVKAPENKFYLNAYTLNYNLTALIDASVPLVNYDALLPLFNGDAQMVKLLPDSMLYALSDNPLDHL